MRRFALVAVLLAASSMATAVDAQNDLQQFNLYCAGTMTTHPTTIRGSVHSQPWEEIYHVDLAERKYCYEQNLRAGCDGVDKVHSFDAEKLVLSLEPRFKEKIIYFSSGKLVHQYDDAIFFVDIEMNCSKQAFTGFPMHVSR